MELENSTVTGSNAGVDTPIAPKPTPVTADIAATTPGEYRVIRRNGKVTAFDSAKIKVAVTKAFLAVEGKNAAASTRIHETVERTTASVVRAITRRMPAGGSIHIEDIQDQVELGLMRGEEHKVARSYVLYREERARERETKTAAQSPTTEYSGLKVTRSDGSKIALDENRMIRLVGEACRDIAEMDPDALIDETKRSLFDGVAENDVSKALIMSARTFIEREPQYTYVAA
ncbi:MAG: ATP cone domain-containing protein, partial [Gammaproteobacteria bacterium]